MSDKLIESFLKYEEQRKAQKNPNEFQNVKNLQEKVTRITASGGANTAQQNAGAGTGYTGGRQANTPVSTTTLSDFPSIENAMKRFGEIRPSANPLNSIASGIGDAVGSIADRLSSSDEPRRQFPTPKAKGEDDGDNPAPASANSDSRSIATSAADQAASADSKQIIPAGSQSIPWGWHRGRYPDGFSDKDRFMRWQFRGYSDPSPKGFERVTPTRPNDDTPANTGDTRFGNFNTDGTVSGNTSVTDARAGVSPAPTATPARPNDGNNGVSAPSQATLNTRPGLKAGPASADTIKALQSHLGITADGIAGPQTRQAVMQFQRDNDLQVDGIIGDQTRMALERSIRMRNQRNESVEFSEAELAHFKSILEAMPVAPTAEGHGPNPTPKNKAEGGKGRGSLSEKMDPVGEEDEDVDNDGKVDKSDEYLRKRRDAISANMKKK